jgi:hypothetical protein
MMRFRGGGIGHASAREATDFFKQDRDSRDAKRVVEEDEDDNEAQYEPTVPNWSRADRDDEEEDYGYNRGEFSDANEEGEEAQEAEEEYSDNEFGPEDDGGEVDEFMDNFGYAEM